jgi:hypothetical protein
MMKRREFLKVGGSAALVGAAGPGSSVGFCSTARAGGPETATKSPLAVVTDFSAAEHRRRLENIAVCERQVRKCLRKHLITDYLPGQCGYNLGEYPWRKPWEDPNDWDEHQLDQLKEHGISLVQLNDEWDDSKRLFGGNRFSPVNPAGFRAFVEMVHRRGMRVIVYASSGFFERPDPDFHKEWARSADQDLVELYWHNAWCSPASTGWRAYVLPRLFRIMDDYGVDGFFDDLGYRKQGGSPGLLARKEPPPTPDEVLAFEESDTHDGALADLLSLIYAEVKRRGGIIKVHYGGKDRPKTDLKVYDYLWVGEGIQSGDDLREAVKNFPPYVIPCLDMSRAKIENEDEFYLHSIPYLQFPYLLTGRPMTGERSVTPGFNYPPEETDFWTRYTRTIWRYYQAHPNGPYTYEWHDSVPGRPEARPTHARWLKQYLPMVEEGTWAWLEISDSGLFPRPLPQNVVASAFANRELYLVLANYGREPVEIETVDAYALAAGPPQGSRQWKVSARSLQILKRAVQA